MHPFAPTPFAPLPWQALAWRCTAPVILLTGSAGGGKSHLAAEKLHGFCLRYPGAMALMVRKTRDSMINSTVLFLQRRIIGPDPHVTHVPTKHRFEYHNGSVLAYGGMADEAQREQIRSIGLAGGLDIAWAEEANRLTEDDFNELLARLRGNAAPWRQLILSTNPDAWSHWINQRLILRSLRVTSGVLLRPQVPLGLLSGPSAALPATGLPSGPAGIVPGAATIFYSSAADNPANPSDYLATLDSLTGTLRARLRDGLWQTAQGAVYDEFDPALHIADLPPDQPLARVYAGVDQGYTNPSCILAIGESPDGHKHALAEFYASRVLQPDLVAAASSLARAHAIGCFYVDPSAPGLIAALRAADLRALPACNNIAAGIATVKAHLRPAADARGVRVGYNDAPRLTFSELCLNTLREIETYVWDQNDRRIAETPAPYSADHAMDALRYALHTRIPVTESVIIEAPDPLLSPRHPLPFRDIAI